MMLSGKAAWRKSITTSSPTSNASGEMLGPITACKSSGRQPKSAVIRSTVARVIPPTVPRHPACIAATTFKRVSATKIGTQSAEYTPIHNPGTCVISASVSGNIFRSFTTSTLHECVSFGSKTSCETTSSRSLVYAAICGPKSYKIIVMLYQDASSSSHVHRWFSARSSHVHRTSIARSSHVHRTFIARSSHVLLRALQARYKLDARRQNV